MNFFISILLGFVEGMTEFLPISSTGHLILASHALGLENSEFLKLFEIVVQTGAISAVICIYWKDLISDKFYYLNIGLAFLPTAVLGLLLHGIVKKYLFTPPVVCGALFVGGIVLLLLENLTAGISKSNMRYHHYFILGLFQCLAFVPGVSRSAATILGGRLLGASREEAVKFSFLLAIPTILAASGYSLLKVNHKLSGEEAIFLVFGLISSFIFGFVSIKVFLKWLNQQTFVLCGLYRIVFAVMFYFIFIF